MKKAEQRLLFVVPFFCDGEIAQVRVYSDPLVAQRALRRWVGYSSLLRDVRAKEPHASRTRAMLDAYGAIERTRWAGTAVYEVPVDCRSPVRR
jgi:hypothetical protein